MKISAPYSDFSDIMLVGSIGMVCYSLVGVSLAPHLAFVAVDMGGTTVFHVMFGWSRVVIV